MPPMPDFTQDLSTADDETIRAALAQAEVPPLLPALASALDDLSLIPEHLRPDLSVLMDPTAGLSYEQQAEAREIAFAALCRLRASSERPGVNPELDDLRHLLEFISGGAEVDEYLELLREELSLGEDLRTPTWTKAEVAPDRRFKVAVIGAGMSGLVAAHRLRQAGIDVVVLEKNDDVGGTWLENSYPGCRVDVSNHFYSYSFAQRPDWPEHFSSQPVLLDYFRGVAEHLDLRPLIRFGHEVTSIELDEPTMTWTLNVVGPGGVEESIEAHAVISAVGQLNRPNLPDIKGMGGFAGPSFHSARWDHEVKLAGQRIAVIGTGASAAQFIPHLADDAAHLTVFQRTPAWFVPTPDYHDPVSDEVQWLLHNVPGYANWYRFWIFWRNVEGLMPAATVDPEWDGGEQSVSQINEFVRQLLTAYLQLEFQSAPELLDAVVPTYPPFAKRFIRDNGIWAKTLTRDNVDLVTETIAEITPEGVRTTDGTLHEADVIIYGTGFKASDFLTPMKVVGRGGTELHERWAGDARAYLGITLPGYPNFFLLYGPNTNIVANGSITYFSECEVHYVVGCLRRLLETGDRAIDPRPEVHDAYNERVDAENLRMAWGVSGVSSWYKNARGRTAQNWPFSLLEYWQLTREPDFADYEVL
ncbi:MAG: 4-hydroxyacetophenone monooxygenase [Actinomycetota bacterium]|nr:4-hydroxyacetophenone monooxygenase [Actinomycetota bacterium]